MTDINKCKVGEEVLERSRRWISSINEGDADGCAAAYKSDAVMNAKPFGAFTGTKEINGFWRPIMSSGPGELACSTP